MLITSVAERKLGVLFGDGVGYHPTRWPDVMHVSDASFVARERVPAGGIPEGFWPFAPDLAVEVVSPHDRAEDVDPVAARSVEAHLRKPVSDNRLGSYPEDGVTRYA